MKTKKLPDNAPVGYYFARLKGSPLPELSSATVLLYTGDSLFSFGSGIKVDFDELEYIHKEPMDLESIEKLLENAAVNTSKTIGLIP